MTIQQWDRFKGLYFESREHGFALDISRMNFPNEFPGQHLDSMRLALEDMAKLEAGAIANRDEKRMVGHYWLRDFKRAPNNEIRSQISNALLNVKKFTEMVHAGKVCAPGEKPFRYLLVIGIGGSALGPEFVNQALGSSRDPLTAFFFDNTDPDGMSKVLGLIPDLDSTLCIVISKSGGTKETRNGQLVARAAYEQRGLEFSKYAIAITGQGSELDLAAIDQKWLARFPMWDWVGGRTSVLSPVGLLPAALQGFDIDSLLRGAREMDELTRRADAAHNPAALMAMMWLYIGQGRGLKDMVVLPYKDRLELFSRYLQQLVMESLGKERNFDGEIVNQGIAVYGNKGSTDQHAYVQQLRDGIKNFFVVFVEVLKDRANLPRLKDANLFDASAVEVEPGITSSDYLSGFFLGTRKALHDSGRESISITIDEVSAYSVGQLIALFERTVGLYASLININAYHQPGVEAGKKAAEDVLALQVKVTAYMAEHSEALTADQLGEALNEAASTEPIFKILRRLAGAGKIAITAGANIFADRYELKK